MARPRPTDSTDKTAGSDRTDRTKSKPAQPQGILSFRDPEELRAARVAEFTGLRDALDASVTRSTVRKTVSLNLFPQSAEFDGGEQLRRAESALTHKLGANHDQTFDVDLVLPLMRHLTPDEQIDVLVFMMAKLGLEVVDGRILPKHRPSKAAAVDALRKDLAAFAGAVEARLASIAGSEEE